MEIIKVPEWLAKMPLMKRFRITAQDIAGNKNKGTTTQVQIVSEYKDKNAKDNKDWRDALQLADDPTNPQWHWLQDMYDYLLVDAHTHSLIELRNMATLSTRNYIYDTKTGEEQPEKTLLFQTEWFFKLCSEALLARARGYTAAQLLNRDTMEFYYIPRRNFVPQRDFIRLSTQSDAGISFADAAFTFINVKDAYLFGYLNDVVPLILWKINAMMSWAEAAERYGIPPLIATTTRRDEKSISDIQNMLSSIGESLTAVLPQGTEIKVMDNSENVDPEKMFKSLVQTCDEQISKRILGGTMITDNGSSRSQSEIHQSNFDDKIAESDKRFIEFFVNGQLMPMMGVFGENDVFAFDRSQKLDLKEHWEIVQGILNTYDVDEDWIKKTFQVPITGKKQTTQNPPSLNFNEAPKAWATALGAYGIQLPEYSSECSQEHNVTADWADDLLSSLSDELINNIWNGNETLINEVLKSVATYRQLLNGLNEGWSNRKDIPYDSPDVHCLSYMEYNLFEFSRLKEKSNVFALNRLLINKEKNNIRSYDDFKAQARQYLSNPDVNWLRAEYNHSIAVGQNASRYHQFKREASSITNYVQWRTVGDDHVRPAHQLLNGKIFRLDEPGGSPIWPPKDWGCRCTMQQYLGEPNKDDLLTNQQGLQILSDNSKNGLPAKWRLNRGEVEQVFTSNEMYYKTSGLQTELNKEINKLTYDKYGLPEMKRMSELPQLNIDTSLTEQDVAKLFKKDKANNMGFEDYLGRKLYVSEKNFNKHNTGSYVSNDNRHQLFPHIEDVLKNPDEVYFVKYGENSFQTNYIKFYLNSVGEPKSILVNTKAGSEGLSINTWHIITKDNDRKGYLINKSRK